MKVEEHLMKFMLTRLRFRCRILSTNVPEVDSITKINMFLLSNYSFFYSRRVRGTVRLYKVNIIVVNRQ